MRLVVQRVSAASVVVAGAEVGAIKTGLLVLLGFEKSDTDTQFPWIISKLLSLRLFSSPSSGSEHSSFDRSVVDVGGGILLVSQFTLLADITKGRRPDFGNALRPEQARELYDLFVAEVKRASPGPVATGVFGAEMQVHSINEGPVTIVIDR